ncbi:MULTISPECIES: DegV family protein [unclassified Fusibacter]|uniref:DegV family protein n=1 Tax=unclassified Fusibacter TaxID=2624464 RepID=UPI00101058F2|nr:MULTISPECIES: DegV family protein [unclassified Fusibacter]MCK8059805.1 DegV family protein [Fusibacter sp. A2]NPE21606.1 DegV family protein [Fusibacter sp. A1]RXV62013.1 DegV family protein [Fusibacter sp. A1]
MEKIAIITDSSCDLTNEQLGSNNIEMLSLKIIYKDREYRDRTEITSDEIYRNLGIEVPKTSLPAPGDVQELLERLKSEGFTHVLGVFISSGLSGTFNMVKQITSDFKEMKVSLVDSKSLSLGLGFAVLEAAKSAREGMEFNDLVEHVKSLRQKINTYYVIKTLEYLKRGGRIGKVEGTVGDLLNIKPIISVNEEGVYYTYKKVRGRKKSIVELIEIVKSHAGQSIKVGVLHGDAEEEAFKIKEVIATFDYVKEVVLEQISPVLTVHTGPGLLGVVIQELT